MTEVAEHVEVHRHPVPTSFIWKYIFSLDHKVIGIPVHTAGDRGRLPGHGTVFAGSPEAGVARQVVRLPGNSVSRGSPGRRDDARVLSGDADHARHDHGLHGADDRSSGRVRQLRAAASNRGGRHGLPQAEHAVVLDHVPFLFDACSRILCGRAGRRYRAGRPTPP